MTDRSEHSDIAHSVVSMDINDLSAVETLFIDALAAL